ncbi:hypothetical protein FQN57_000792 [Myotisia sp. PD_48]|nr:hypothetical protein FQN57_000792 [Myotisia sp. PD_48]
MSNDPNRQGQQLPHPPPWTSGPPDYPNPQYQTHTSQPPYPYPPPASMAAIPQQHPQQDPYRLPHPHPHAQYSQRPPDMYAPQAPAPPPVVYQAAAPRQRTAIACRYCRRRKIRCSGFDTSQDGRCSNCVRFNQECMFTPVSSQTQAFVPAHTAYPHLRAAQGGRRPGEVILYGPQGHPLPPPNPPLGLEQTLPPPHGMYQHPPPIPYGRNPGPGDERATLPPPLSHPPPMIQDPVSRKRPLADDPHQPTSSQLRLSPSASNSGSSHSSPQRAHHVRRPSGGGTDYGDPPTLPPVSVPPSTSGYSPQSTPVSASYFSSSQQDRRLSSHSSYSYDQPHGGAPTPTSNLPYPTLHPLHHTSMQPSREAGQTPPPGQSGRSGLSVRDMLGPGEGQSTRSSTDSDMLNALNRRGLNKAYRGLQNKSWQLVMREMDNGYGGKLLRIDFLKS